MQHLRATGDVRTRRSGFTIVEFAVTFGLAVMLTMIAVYLAEGAGDSLRSGLAANEIDTTLRRVVGRINEDMQLSGSTEFGADQVASHPIGIDTTASSITFKRRVGVSGYASDWSEQITYSLLPSMNELPNNGIDDDGDGVIDERILVRSENTALTVLADNITTAVFSRNSGEYRIDIAFTVARASQADGGLTSRTLETTVALRNRNMD